MKQHTVRAFDEALRTVAADVLDMGQLVRNQLAVADALLGDMRAGDKAAIEATENDINALDRKISDEVQRILALRQPLGVDLRTLISCDRIATDLERIADHAKNIARRVAMIAEQGTSVDLTRTRTLAGRALGQLDAVLEAIEQRDIVSAKAVWRADSDIDSLYDETFHALVQEMCREPQVAASYTNALFIAKSLERVGDHVTNIAEDLVYWVACERLNKRDADMDGS
ncbi:phosphate transport system regulatory protein PhoU [Thioflavicoccus mobilis 8321]|uniref:Phosphate-specific transport system accessory protein PhoU n=1 Tax=Thioflavicoccus mobilis 8321 TaxID=765912 RepID=L0GX08_9GAMM|nr:phosphate signaling complex protein PhoU [Thioflavicoccus mobilis]AGA90491.1 phosphate transport system regulatory protein PhoU [Thioflavicoccus mobilis 8321]